jgi:hypothetical protein
LELLYLRASFAIVQSPYKEEVFDPSSFSYDSIAVRFHLDQLNKKSNAIQKDIGLKMKVPKKECLWMSGTFLPSQESTPPYTCLWH